jgi:hypothetical protein
MKSILIIFSFFITLQAVAQKASWPAMHQFHTTLSKTYHEAENGNLLPLKDSASVLLNRAVVWQKSNVPNGYNKAVVKPILQKLVLNCKALDTAVKKQASSKELISLITTIHNTFHTIVEKCQPNSENHH